LSQKTKKFSIGQIGKPFIWYYGLKVIFNIYILAKNKKVIRELEGFKDFFWLLFFVAVEITAKELMDNNKLALFTLPLILVDTVPFIINIDKLILNRIAKIYELFFSIQMFFISLIVTQKLNLINKEISLAVIIADGIFQFLEIVAYLFLFVSLPLGLIFKKQITDNLADLSYMMINILFLGFKAVQKMLIITYIWLMIEFDLINIS
jgi:hypothetical protein